MGEEIRILKSFCYFPFCILQTSSTPERACLWKKMSRCPFKVLLIVMLFLYLPNSHCIKMAMLATVRTSIKVQIIFSGFRTICVVLVERMCLIIRSFWVNCRTCCTVKAHGFLMSCQWYVACGDNNLFPYCRYLQEMRIYFKSTTVQGMCTARRA